MEIGKIPYKFPSFDDKAFNCPYCKAYAHQLWFFIYYWPKGNTPTLLKSETGVESKVSICSHCNKISIWHEGKMIYPDFYNVEPPNEDLNEEIKNDYMEAASVLYKSPRSAAALLRLALQKLMKQLSEKGENLNEDIANLVKKGLPIKIQQALDVIRVIGNEAVHPGTLDLRDDIETAKLLFSLINIIAEKMITDEKKINKIYLKLPENKRKQIEERDKRKITKDI